MPDSIGRVKACNECRQQKVRCDAFKDYSQPCKRCRTGGLPCVISKDFRRRPRQSKAQLQHEIERLRAQAEGSGDMHEEHISLSSYDESPIEQAGQKRSHQHTDHPSIVASAYPAPSSSLREHMLPALTPQSDFHKQSYDRNGITWSESTVDRSLEAISLDSIQIDDCYSAFLNHYAPYLEGLIELHLSPNERYQQSPLLFWTMILVGSRGYEQDLNIYTRLGEPVLDLIFKSCLRPEHPLLVIQAIVIFCNWPLPVDFTYKDTSHTLAGAALGIALQSGLHMYTREQDFVVKPFQSTAKPALCDRRDPVRDDAVACRIRVWAYCYISLQGTFIDNGLPPPAPARCFKRSLLHDDVLYLQPEMTAFRLRLHELKVDTLNQIANASDLQPSGSEPTLNAIIRSSERRILEVALPQDTRIYRLLRNSSQVFVLGLIFLAQREPLYEDILRLYRIARELIDDATELDHEIRNFTFFVPESLMRIIILVGHILLRVPKSPLGADLDMADAEAAIHKCIDIFSKRSQSNKDLYARQIVAFRQLWSSKRAFVRDGQPQNGLRVDMRYRLAYNPVFDSMWWWRMEFGPQAASANSKCRRPTQLEQQPPRQQEQQPGSLNLHTTWSNIPNSTSESDPDHSSGQGMTQIAPLPDETFSNAGSTENIFEGFLDWWDLSDFPMDTFQTDFGYSADPSALNDLGGFMPLR